MLALLFSVLRGRPNDFGMFVLSMHALSTHDRSSWPGSGKGYRVVYGDLSVKDVAPEDLPLPVGL